MKYNDIYEWMLINVKKLVEAVKIDGRIGGPSSDAMLEEAHKLQCPGRTKSDARRLLNVELKLAGLESVGEE